MQLIPANAFRTRPSRGALLAGALLCNLPGTAAAFEVEAAAELGSRTTTNARRFGRDEQADTQITPAVLFNAQHEGPSLKIESGYNLRRRIFVRDFFNDENIFTGGTSLAWEALPERLDLGLRHVRRETTNQSFGRGTQDDRQITNTTEGNAGLKFRPRETDELKFSYKYTLLDDENFDIDNERTISAVSYRSRLSPTTSVELYASEGDVDFDSSLVADIDIETYTMTVRRSGQRLSWRATGGYSNYEPDAGEGADGTIFNLSAIYSPVGGREFELAAVRAISERAGQVDSVEDAIENPTDIPFANSDLTDVFVSTNYTATYREAFGPNMLEAALVRTKVNFQNFDRDQTTDALEIGLTRAIRRSIDGFVQLNYQRSNYDELDADFRQWFLDLGATYRVARRLEVSGQLFHLRRSSNASLAGDFDDTGIELSARYTFLSRGDAREQEDRRRRRRR